MDDDFVDRRSHLLSVREVAARLGVSDQHVYALIRDKKVPASNIGRGMKTTYRIRPEDVEAFVVAARQ